MGVLDRRDRDKDNETGLKEGGVIEMSTTVLSIYAMHRSLSLKNTYQRGSAQRLRISSGKQCTAMYDWQDIGIQQDFTDLVHGPSIKPYWCWQQRTVAHGSFHHCFSGFMQHTCSKIKIATQEQCSCKERKV